MIRPLLEHHIDEVRALLDAYLEVKYGDEFYAKLASGEYIGFVAVNRDGAVIGAV